MSNIFKFRQPPPGFVSEYYGGGKSSTSTQTVSIPPEVMARYNAVNARAEQVAETPFQQYGGQFVAGLTPTQQAGIQATNVASQTAQPYYGMGAGLTLAGAQDVGPLTQGQIGYYQNPAMLATLAPTAAALRQQQGQQLSQQQADAIKAGAFGGSRADLQRAQLMGQQQLGMGQALAPIYQQAYQTGLQTAQQQQGVVAQDLARRMQAGQQIAGLGTGAQQAALQGAQAQLQAGTAEQQTQQADLTARYQQFLQERGYPFQVAQFLANIAMGTGALSGSTTTTTQPAGFFSDKRLKHDAHRIGETDDGLPIYSFKYNGDDKTQIGLMAQDVEKKRPEAVGLAPAADGKMYKTVDYEKATRRGRDAGGLIPSDMDENSMGGAVSLGDAMEAFARGGYADGGLPYGQGMGPYGAGLMQLPQAKMMLPGKAPEAPKSGAMQAMQMGKGIADTWNAGKDVKKGLGEAFDWAKEKIKYADGGLIVHRKGYSGEDGDSSVTPGDEDEKKSSGLENRANVPSSGFPSDVLQSGSQHAQLATAGAGPGKAPSGAQQLAKGLGMAKAGMDAGKGLGKLGSLFSGGAETSAIPEVIDLTTGAAGAAEGAGMLGSLGSTLGTAAEGIGSILPFLAFLERGGAVRSPYAYGGLIAREHHAAGEETGSETAPVSLFERPVEAAPAEPVQQRGLMVREEPRQERPDYRGMVIEAAKKHGIDPDHAVRLAQGESGLVPRSGDDGSSGSIFQLHVGGLSKQYPNSGLGDVYFQQRRPDLVKLSPQEKIAYLNDPRNQADIADFSAEHISQKGARPWTVARNQGLFGLGTPTSETGSARRPGVLPTEYSGTPARQASLGDVAGEMLPKGIPTESSFWVPALGFVGSMLASQRPTLGGAIGEGLLGGVGAYQANQKQQMEMARDLRKLFDDRFVQGIIPNDPAKYGANAGKPGFLDKNTQSWLTPDQVNEGKRGMANDLGIPPSYLGVPRAPTRPMTPVEAQTTGGAGAGAGTGTTGAGTGAADQPTPTTTPKAEPSKAPEVVTIAGTTNPQDVFEMEPAQLINRIKEGGDAAYDAAGLKGTLDPRPLERDLEAIRSDMRSLETSGLATTPDGKTRLEGLRTQAADLESKIVEKYKLGIAKQLEMNQEDAKIKMQGYQKYTEGVMKRQDEYKTVRRNFTDLANLYADFAAGRLSDWKAEIRGWAKAAGVSDALPAGWDTGDFDTAVKYAYKAAFKQVADSSMVRAPATSLREANATVAEPTRDPGAIMSIIGNAIGELDYVHERDNKFLDSRSRDPVRFVQNYERTSNDLPTKAAAYSEIPLPKDIEPAQVQRLMQRYRFIPKGVDPESVGEVRYSGNLGIVRRVNPETKKAEFFYFKKDRD